MTEKYYLAAFLAVFSLAGGFVAAKILWQDQIVTSVPKVSFKVVPSKSIRPALEMDAVIMSWFYLF